jgi:hypothetical protein
MRRWLWRLIRELPPLTAKARGVWHICGTTRDHLLGWAPWNYRAFLVTVAGRRLPFDGDVAGTPLPMQTVQMLGAQVCAFPSQVHPSAGTRPPPEP